MYFCKLKNNTSVFYTLMGPLPVSLPQNLPPGPPLFFNFSDYFHVFRWEEGGKIPINLN